MFHWNRRIVWFQLTAVCIYGGAWMQIISGLCCSKKWKGCKKGARENTKSRFAGSGRSIPLTEDNAAWVWNDWSWFFQRYTFISSPARNSKAAESSTRFILADECSRKNFEWNNRKFNILRNLYFLAVRILHRPTKQTTYKLEIIHDMFESTILTIYQSQVLLKGNLDVLKRETSTTRKRTGFKPSNDWWVSSILKVMGKSWSSKVKVHLIKERSVIFFLGYEEDGIVLRM